MQGYEGLHPSTFLFPFSNFIVLRTLSAELVLVNDDNLTNQINFQIG